MCVLYTFSQAIISSLSICAIKFHTPGLKGNFKKCLRLNLLTVLGFLLIVQEFAYQSLLYKLTTTVYEMLLKLTIACHWDVGSVRTVLSGLGIGLIIVINMLGKITAQVSTIFHALSLSIMYCCKASNNTLKQAIAYNSEAVRVAVVSCLGLDMCPASIAGRCLGTRCICLKYVSGKIRRH